jgi:hypothetical protein
MNRVAEDFASISKSNIGSPPLQKPLAQLVGSLVCGEGGMAAVHKNELSKNASAFTLLGKRKYPEHCVI